MRITPTKKKYILVLKSTVCNPLESGCSNFMYQLLELSDQTNFYFKVKKKTHTFSIQDNTFLICQGPHPVLTLCIFSPSSPQHTSHTGYLRLSWTQAFTELEKVQSTARKVMGMEGPSMKESLKISGRQFRIGEARRWGNMT